MTSEIGFSEFCLLLFLALVLISPKDVANFYVKFKKFRGKLYRMRFDLEDGLMQSVNIRQDFRTQGERQQTDRNKESAWIVEALKGFAPYREASKVAAFNPMPTEPDIRTILEELAHENRLLLPKTLDGEQMEFVEIRDLQTDLVEGRFHIFEPRPELPIYRGPIPLALVPGVRFSRDGGRKGHGKGYYDRFLARHPETVKCGVAFCAQVADAPLELKPHDILMNYIVAPRNFPDKETPHVEKTAF